MRLYCYRSGTVRGLYVCVLGTSMSSVETDEPIAMLFGWQVRVGPLRKHVLYGGAIGTSWRIQMND